jgi:integrase
LYVRPEETGAKFFVLRYRVDGRDRWHTLGQFGDPPLLPLAAARALAHSWRERIAGGEYPHEVAERQREAAAFERQTRAEAPTLDDLAKLFRAKYLDKHTRRPADRMVSYEKHVAPVVGKMKLADIRRRHLNAVLDDVAEAHPVAAYKLARLIGQMLRFAVDEELIEASPAERLKKGKPAGLRDRVLTDDEIRIVWTTLEGAGPLPMAQNIRLALRLLLLTGARAGELCGARWADVRLEGDMPLWTIPRDATKTGAAHTVPLAPTAVELFTRLRELTGDTEFVLPAGDRLMGARRTKPRKRPPSASLDPHALAVAIRRCRDAGKFPQVADFGAHDARRTMRTGLARIGFSIELAERTIGHKPRNLLVQVYDKYDRLAERRRALFDWDSEVRRIVAGKLKVVAQLRPDTARSPT